MEKEKKYFGIYFNEDIPQLDKINKYHKEVAIKFEGKAYQIQRKNKDEVEKIEIDEEHILKKEGNYEIEFTNLANETYLLQIKIENSYLFLLFLFFLLGLLMILLMAKPLKKGESPLERFFDYINLAVLPLEVDQNLEAEKQLQNQYVFDMTQTDMPSQNVNLIHTLSVKSLAKCRVAPGDAGSFSIVINAQKSRVDMRYGIQFQDENGQKPSHIVFKIRGEEETYGTLQEMEKRLSGNIEAKSQKTIILDWEWKFETGENEEIIGENDKIDTKEGEELDDYQFKILVTGEEVE